MENERPKNTAVNESSFEEGAERAVDRVLLSENPHSSAFGLEMAKAAQAVAKKT